MYTRVGPLHVYIVTEAQACSEDMGPKNSRNENGRKGRNGKSAQHPESIACNESL